MPTKWDIKSWPEALPSGGDEGVVAVYGHRRNGKTGTVYFEVEALHEKDPTRTFAAFGFPKARRARKLLPKWMKFVDTLKQLAKLPPRTVVVADELALQAHARDHQQQGNKDWAKLIAVCGQCHHLLFLICQHTRQPDVSLAMDPDIIIMKMPSHLHIRFARPELRQEVQEAWDAFQVCRGDHRSWNFIVDYHNLRKGWLKSGLPSFWSEELSEAYGRWQLTEILSEPNENGRRRSKVFA